MYSSDADTRCWPNDLVGVAANFQMQMVAAEKVEMQLSWVGKVTGLC